MSIAVGLISQGFTYVHSILTGIKMTFISGIITENPFDDWHIKSMLNKANQYPTTPRRYNWISVPSIDKYGSMKN